MIGATIGMKMSFIFIFLVLLHSKNTIGYSLSLTNFSILVAARRRARSDPTTSKRMMEICENIPSTNVAAQDKSKVLNTRENEGEDETKESYVLDKFSHVPKLKLLMPSVGGSALVLGSSTRERATSDDAERVEISQGSDSKDESKKSDSGKSAIKTSSEKVVAQKQEDNHGKIYKETLRTSEGDPIHESTSTASLGSQPDLVHPILSEVTPDGEIKYNIHHTPEPPEVQQLKTS